MADTRDLPFDQFQRYELVRALLEDVRRDGEAFHILDVGGRTALLREFLPDDRIDLVDVDPSTADGLVLGSGAELPFRDGSFDAVCGFDTLEHVPPPLRDAFVRECARVARRHVILAGPYDAPRVAEAEEILLDFLKVRLEWEHGYLAEHRSNGLPDMAAARQILEAAGARVEAFGHGALDRWLGLMAIELYAEHEPLLRAFVPRVYRFYNEHVFRSDHGGDVYRHALVAAFGDAPMPSLEGALDPAGSEPAEANRTLVDLGREILRYDALRDSFQPEMRRLHGVVERAVDDVEQHRRALEETSTDLEGHRRSLESTTADLEEHRRTLAALRAENREHVAALEGSADELREELRKHQEVVAELQGLREAELAELGLRGDRLQAAEALLAENAASMESARERVVGALGGADEAPHGLSLHDAIEGLVEERDRAAREYAEARRALEQRLEQERWRNAELARESQRLWNRIGRAIVFRRLDPELVDGAASPDDGSDGR
ncbi:MAG: methyltransferase domain-containing protein [Planctomycetota bacterium]